MGNKNVPETVEHIDLNKYVGKWYEIARLPSFFEDGDENVTATYTLDKDTEGRNYVRVSNRSIKNGKVHGIDGKAYPLDSSNSKLKVKFDPFYIPEGEYWIVMCNVDYQYAVVSDSDRSYLWILARTPQIDINLYNTITDSLIASKFNLSRLIKTIQN